MTIAFAAEPTTEATASRLLATIERIWAEIQRRHPDTPEVFFTLGAGSASGSRGTKLGHFGPDRWTIEDDRRHEIFVGGEGLALGAVETLGTLLHEAAHAIAHTRGIKDTSRQGRWHNTKFAEIGRELGLQLEQHPRIGWSITSVPVETQLGYTDLLLDLDAELMAHRRWEAQPTGGTTGGDGGSGGAGGGVGTTIRRSQTARCGCGRAIRVARDVLAAGPIACGICGSAFAHED